MKDKKQIDVPSLLISDIFISLFIAWVLVLVIEHSGKFNYMAAYRPPQGERLSFESQVSADTPLAHLELITPFGNQVRVLNPPMDMGELHYNFDYFKKLEYYISGTKADFVFVIIFAVIITLIIAFFRKFKIKLT